MDYKLTDFLPTTKKEVELRGWDELDVILFSGDAYVDHPSFGAAVIGRILEAEGLKVAIIGRLSGSHRSPARLARRFPRLQETRSPSPLLWCFSGCHGLDGEPLHGQPPHA